LRQADELHWLAIAYMESRPEGFMAMDNHSETQIDRRQIQFAAELQAEEQVIIGVPAAS